LVDTWRVYGNISSEAKQSACENKWYSSSWHDSLVPCPVRRNPHPFVSQSLKTPLPP